MIRQEVFSNQKQLEEAIHQIFPNQKILTNVRKEGNLQNPNTNLFLELDVWIPTLNLCFEFQDVYHYTTTWYSHAPLTTVHIKDNLKNKMMHLKEADLIVVPFWWDGDAKSLESAIHFKRPDLVSLSSFLPISSNPPLGYIESRTIPHVGSLMLASFPPETSLFVNGISIENSWWLGEKYDGIRFCWNPLLGEVFSRSGLPLYLPEVFLEHMSPEFLEGEIWFGRGGFREAQRIVHSDEEVDWPSLREVTFDVPNFTAHTTPFELRYSNLLWSISAEHPFLTPAIRVLCSSTSFLKKTTTEILEGDGEGVVLRKPLSLYLPGRSDSLFKFKAMTADGEALVIGEQDGMPLLKLPNGATFQATYPEDASLRELPKKGDVVTYTFQHQSRQSTPSNPAILRIREDVDWNDVLRNYTREIEFSGPSRKALGFSQKPTGYWRTKNRKNVRKFLENYAAKNNLDPLVADSWYSLSANDLLQEEGAASLLAYYNGSLVQAILDLFPEISDLDEAKFAFVPKNYWNSPENRRNVFTDVSKEIGFDPLVAEAWYSNYWKFLEKMEGHYVSSLYGGSIKTAIVHVFPEVGLDKSKLLLPPEYWMDEEHRRSFFLKFAAAKGFEPLLPENWYFTKLDHFKATKYGMTVLSFYGGSHVKALMNLFPDIGLQSERFFKKEFSENLISLGENARQFFMDFAADRNFDALVAENWYSIRKEDIESAKNGRKITESYGRSHIQALLETFPNIGLDRQKFKLPSNHWKIAENQKLFFAQFASAKGLNPLKPASWYQIRYSDVYSTKHGKSVLSCHGGSYTRAIMFCYPKIGLKNELFEKKKKIS